MTAATHKAYCEDWACPALVSCALHIGRSRHYAEMRERSLDLFTPPRTPDADFCALYRFDKAKPWLQPAPGQVTHVGRFGHPAMPSASRC